MGEDEYMTVGACTRLHSESEKRQVEIMARLDELNARLYKDNGKLSIQTRLDRGDRILGVLCWVTSVAGSAIIVGVLAYIWKVVTHVGA